MTEPPTFDRVLVAVDDSPAALAAVAVGVALAVRCGARMRFVHVIADGELLRALTRMGRDWQRTGERAETSLSLLRHVSLEADRAGVEADTLSLSGDPATMLLDAARSWQADLVVLGRSDVGQVGRAYVGEVTRGVLEFSETPVLVVPRPS
jgi:nucleotide-binding universal stress UspA family protein